MSTLSFLWTQHAFILEIVRVSLRWWSQNTVFICSTIQASLTINLNALFLGKKFCSAVFSSLQSNALFTGLQYESLHGSCIQAFSVKCENVLIRVLGHGAFVQLFLGTPDRSPQSHAEHTQFTCTPTLFKWPKTKSVGLSSIENLIFTPVF